MTAPEPSNIELFNFFVNFMQVFVFPCLAWIAWTVWNLSHKVTKLETLLEWGVLGKDEGGSNNGR